MSDSPNVDVRFLIERQSKEIDDVAKAAGDLTGKVHGLTAHTRAQWYLITILFGLIIGVGVYGIILQPKPRGNATLS
jgi:hypothetical protein